MVITGESGAELGSTAVERGECGDGSGKPGEVGVGGIILYLTFDDDAQNLFFSSKLAEGKLVRARPLGRKQARL